mmetsp:Transcript_24762/g.39755  ORF Transcript_24762/g.39755 Transcript_24762/m.39755 type:complete len:645 (+) Transcript_24762:79-2013(+)
MGGGASKKSKKKNAKKPGDADGSSDISAAALRRRRVLFGHEAVQEFENLSILEQYTELPTDNDDRVFGRFEHNGGLAEANRIRQKMANIRSTDGYLRYNALELLQIGIGSDQKVARRLYELARVERPSKRQLLHRSGASTDLGEKEKPPTKEEEAPSWTRHDSNCIGCYEFLALFSVIRFGDIDELLELLFCFFDFDEDDRVSVTDLVETIESFLTLSKGGNGKFRDALLKLDLLGTELDEYHKLDEAKQRVAIHRSAELAVWKYGNEGSEALPDDEAGDLEEDTDAEPAPAQLAPPPPTETVEAAKAKAKPKPSPKPKKKSGRGLCRGKQPESDTETDITDVKEEKDAEGETEDSKGSKEKKGENDSKTQKGKDGKAEKEGKKEEKDGKKASSSIVGEDDSENSDEEVGKKQDGKEEEVDDKAQKAGCCGRKAKKATPKKEAAKKDAEKTDTDSKSREGVDAQKKEMAKPLLGEDSDEEEAVPKSKDSSKDPKGDDVKIKADGKEQPKDVEGAKSAAKSKAKAKARKSSGGGCLPCCRAKPKAASTRTPTPLTFDQWKKWFCDFVEVPEEVFNKKSTMPVSMPVGAFGQAEPGRTAIGATMAPDRQMTGYPPSAQFPTIDTRQGYSSSANNMQSRGRPFESFS